MVAPKLRFSRGLKAKAPGAVTACVPAATPLAPVEIFTGARRYPLNTRSNDGEGEDFLLTFEGLSSVRLLFYQRFDAALSL